MPAAGRGRVGLPLTTISGGATRDKNGRGDSMGPCWRLALRGAAAGDAADTRQTPSPRTHRGDLTTSDTGNRRDVQRACH